MLGGVGGLGVLGWSCGPGKRLDRFAVEDETVVADEIRRGIGGEIVADQDSFPVLAHKQEVGPEPRELGIKDEIAAGNQNRLAAARVEHKPEPLGLAGR